MVYLIVVSTFLRLIILQSTILTGYNLNFIIKNIMKVIMFYVWFKLKFEKSVEFSND